MTRLERKSRCKINLLLNILGKRPDGFHELETLMQPVPLEDTLTFEPLVEPVIELTCSNSELPTDSRNLVYRAAVAFRKATALDRGVRMHLDKRVPLAAGLGGGSANAAAALLGLNDLFETGLSEKELQVLASELGSDVPFFLQECPALATGRGEQIEPLIPFGALRDGFVLLIHPGFGVSTAWAYGALSGFPEALNGNPGRARQLASALTAGTLKDVGPLLYNSLELPVLRKYPVLELYQEFLRAGGAAATLMSGSGSTTFALVNAEQSARTLLRAFTAKFGENCWTTLIPLGEA
jgi:4-diphosphocytidyl-2-C-methyl-D-erythritol kinase